MYQREGRGAPVGVADDECEIARVQVWRQGHGWVDRPADWDAETKADAGEEPAA